MTGFRWLNAVVLSAMLAGALPIAAEAGGADIFTTRWPREPAVRYETGLRYWYGWAQTAKDLYDTTGSVLVSRLDYDGMRLHAGEAFLRADSSNGLFVKGYIGAGGLFTGNLQDEDFLPGTTPYSSTNSRQSDGTLYYGSADIGYRVIRGGDFDVGAFVGYHVMRQYVSAYGCAQTAGNASICGTPIPETVQVISQTNTWHSARLGLDAHLALSPRLRLSVEGAWLPYVELRGSDAHWLRIGSSFTGPIPEDGKGWGYQFEGVLSYQVTDMVSIGLGGRYWHAETTRGYTHFENHVITGTAYPQDVRWSVDTYGVFLQGSVRL